MRTIEQALRASPISRDVTAEGIRLAATSFASVSVRLKPEATLHLTTPRATRKRRLGTLTSLEHNHACVMIVSGLKTRDGDVITHLATASVSDVTVRAIIGTCLVSTFCTLTDFTAAGVLKVEKITVKNIYLKYSSN